MVNPILSNLLRSSYSEMPVLLAVYFHTNQINQVEEIVGKNDGNERQRAKAWALRDAEALHSGIFPPVLRRCSFSSRLHTQGSPPRSGPPDIS